jgi:phage terminase small subunit
MPAAAAELTDRELAFLANYLVEPNATRAYLRSHPAAAYNTARTEAAKLLAKPDIKRRLGRMRKAVERKAGVDAARVLREFGFVAFADPGDLFEEDPHTGLPRPRPWSQVPPAARRAVASVKVKKRVVRRPGSSDLQEEVEEVEYKLASKLDALDKVSRHLGLYKDLPPLEMILALLSPDVADAVRRRAVEALPGGGGGGGGPGEGGGTGGAGGGPAGPGGGVPGAGVGAGPVAGGVPAGESPADPHAVLPAGREECRERGEDLGALFDDP